MKAKVNLGNGLVDVTVRDINLDAEVVEIGGRQLTELTASRLEHEYARAGRPHLDRNHGDSVHVGFRVTQADKTRLKDRATRDGVRESDVLRAALGDYLAG